jgi:hypothetical protein
MNAIAALILASTIGVDYGWHRATDGEWEYIIQIEPGLVETLTKGQALVSQMPPELRGVRRFRIQIGQGEVPREPLPPGGIASLNGLSDGRSGPAGAAGLPLDPAPGWGGGYDFLRQNPIRLEPLENTFLNDPRLRVLDSGRDAWDGSARSGTATSPWNPLGRPAWNTNAGALSNGTAPGAFPPAGSGPNSLAPAAAGPGTFASGGYGGGGNMGTGGGFNAGAGSGFAADNAAFGIGPDPAPFASGNRWGGEPLLPERPRLEFETPEDAAASRRLRLNEPAGSQGRGFGSGLPNSLPGSGLAGLPRPAGGQGATNLGTLGSANQGLSGPGFNGQGLANPGLGNQGFGNQGFGNQGFGNQGFGNQGFGNQAFGNQGFGNQGVGNQGVGNQGVGNQGFGGPSFSNPGLSGAGPSLAYGQAGGAVGTLAAGTNTFAGPIGAPPFSGSAWSGSGATGAASRPPAISLSAPGAESGREGGAATDQDGRGFANGRGARGANGGSFGAEAGRLASTSVAGNRPAARAEISRSSTQPVAFIQSPTDRIWWPLTMTVLLLFGSLGGNFYLGWLAMDFYRRYRECAWQLRTGP